MNFNDEIASGFTIEEMVVELKKGDMAFFEPLFLRFQPLVGKISSLYNVRTLDGDDFLQEAQIVLYSAIELYDDEKGLRFASYYKLLLQNRIYSLIRKETATKRTVDHRSVSYESYCAKGGNIDSLTYKNGEVEVQTPEKLFQIKESSQNYVNQLSDFEREVFFYYLEGYENEKIAKLTKRSLTQVRNAYDRCRKKLRDELL